MKHRPNGAFIWSVALHIVLGAGLVWLLAIPIPIHEWWKAPAEPAAEHVAYIVVPDRAPTATAGRSGGNNRPEAVRRSPAIDAPTTIPSSIPQPATHPSPAAGGGAGPVVGSGGPEVGVRPSYSDPRIWLPPGEVVGPAKTQSERLDSVLVAHLQPYIDSLRQLADHPGKAPDDWTFGSGSGKWGIDPKHIYLGGHSIPTAILALLPLSKGANPVTTGENKALAYERTDIQYQAQRAMNEEEFKEAVKRIRERKQREHDAELADRKRQREKSDTATVIHP